MMGGHWSNQPTTYFYEKQLPHGDILRTKVSMGTGEIGPDLFSRILKKQLQVDKKYFNSKI
jgi:hypothetical protein